MKRRFFLRCLLAAATVGISHPAPGAELLGYQASAPPGGAFDANDNSVQVWKVEQGPHTGSGFATEAGDPHVWRISNADGAGFITQTHRFTGGALIIGQAVSIDWAHAAHIEPGKRVGLRLLNADGGLEVEVAFIGGGHEYVYSDAAARDTPIGQTYSPHLFLPFVLRVTGATTYEGSLDGLTWRGSFSHPIAQIQVFDDNAGHDSDQYTDHLAVSTRQPVAVEHQARIGAGTVLFVPQGYQSAKTPSLAFAAPPVEQGATPAGWKLVPEYFQENGKPGAAITVPPGSSLYGTGEVTGPLLRNGRFINLWNTDNYNYHRGAGLRLYQSHPWVLGVRPDGSAFGIIFDTTWKGTLSTGSDKIVLSSEGAPFRVAIIDRESPQAVVRGLAEFTGKMPLPPKWALGFHQCRYSYYPDSKVRAIADRFRQDQLPCDVLWLDIDYMDGFRVFTFDPKKFPDPKATNDYLHAQGFHSVWMIDPGVKKDPGYAVYDSGSKEDVWVQTVAGNSFVGKVWPGDCVFPDFTMPAARQWWAGLYKDYIAKGIDGVWNDMDEPAVFDGPDNSMPENNVHRGGGELPAGPHLLYHQRLRHVDGLGDPAGHPRRPAGPASVRADPLQPSRRSTLRGDLDRRQQRRHAVPDHSGADVAEPRSLRPTAERAGPRRVLGGDHARSVRQMDRHGSVLPVFAGAHRQGEP